MEGVSSADGRLLSREPDGTLAGYADLGVPGWNDIVVDGRGNAYVNRAGFEDVKPGFVHLVTPDGAVREAADDIASPNGMALSVDGSPLIVADSYRHRLVAFTVDADGGLSGRRVRADLGEGTPDGIRVDAEDAVRYADVPNCRCVRVADGAPSCGPCPWTGAGRTLFVTAARRQGMTEREMVAPGSGQVLTVPVEVAAP